MNLGAGNVAAASPSQRVLQQSNAGTCDGDRQPVPCPRASRAGCPRCYDPCMRTPGRRRARPQRLALDVAPDELREWAAAVRYIGSPEHKSYPSFAGQPRLRSDATPCPKEINNAEEITGWLREGIRNGNVSAYRDQNRFPRYVWAKREGRWFEARVVNSHDGSYKGYPVAEDDVPPQLRKADR